MLSAEFIEKIHSDKHDKDKNTNKTQINAKLINFYSIYLHKFRIFEIYLFFKNIFIIINSLCENVMNASDNNRTLETLMICRSKKFTNLLKIFMNLLKIFMNLFKILIKIFKIYI